jgi:hypothetical protein
LSGADASLLRERLELLRELSADDQAALLGGALQVCTDAEAELLGPALLELMLREGGARTAHAAARHPSALANAHGSDANRSDAQARASAQPQSQEQVVQALRVKYGLAPEQAPQRHRRDEWLARWSAIRANWREIPALAWRIARDQGGWALGLAPRAQETPSEAPRVALVRAWHRLPESVRAAALASDGDDRRWRAAALAALQDRGVAQFVIDRGDPALADLLATPLQQAHTASAAQHALLALAWLAQSKRDPEWMTLALQGEGLLPAPHWRGWTGIAPSGARDNQRNAEHERQRVLDSVLASALDPRTGGSRTPAARTPRGVLLAALVWLDPSRLRHAQLTQAARALNEPTHPALPELGGLLRTSRTPVARLRALQWLGVDGLAGVLSHASTARLSVSHGSSDQEAVLQAGHLALRPRRAGALRRVVVRGARVAARQTDRQAPRSTLPATSKPPAPSPASAAPRRGDLHVLTPAARRMLPTWTRAIAMDAPAREAALAPLLLDEDPCVRLACIRRGVASLTRDLLFDANASVARSALLRAIDDQESRAGLARAHPWPGPLADDLRALHRSPHRALAGASAREARATGDWLDDTPAGRLGALRRLGEDRAATVGAIRDALASPNPAQLASALRLVRLLRVWNDAEEPLIRLALRAGPADARAAATAVAMLANVSTDPARKAVTGCLSHADARVRANAVESIARSAAQGQPQLAAIAELKADAHHRVRANAVRGELVALIRSAQPASLAPLWRDQLRSMLTHDSPMHRLAGVWLASRTIGLFGDSPAASGGAAVAEVGQRVVELAQFDADLRVRRRALAIARGNAHLAASGTGRSAAHD